MFLPMLLVFAATEAPTAAYAEDPAFDAFVALVPPAKPDPKAQMLLARLNQSTLAELKKLNPGRDKEVSEAIAHSSARQRTASDENRLQTLRASARPLAMRSFVGWQHFIPGQTLQSLSGLLIVRLIIYRQLRKPSFFA